MSPHTQGLWGTLRAKARRRLHGPSTAEPSEMGPLHTRSGQAEEHAQASWRTRAGALGVGSAASCRCRRISRITSALRLIGHVTTARHHLHVKEVWCRFGLDTCVRL